MSKPSCVLVFLGLSLFFSFAGCKDGRPLSPSRVTSLNVSIPAAGEVSSSLAGSGSNEIYYRVEGSDMETIKGTLQPFSTAGVSGTINFNVDIPGGGKRLLSVQLNQAGTHLPLALGAVEINFANSSPVTDVLVEMGSVTRNCYYSVIGNTTAASYGLGNHHLSQAGGTGALYDVQFAILDFGANLFELVEARTSTPTASNIAYLGNGDMVDFDKLPPASAFSPYSALSKGGAMRFLEAGDVYCVKLGTMPGHAWIQIIDPGVFNNNSPYFRFRANSALDYYAYDHTPADSAATCLGTW